MNDQPMSLQLPRNLNAPFLAEYFGVWAVKEDFFRAAVERISSMDLALHIRTQREQMAQQDAQENAVQAAGGQSANPLYRVTMSDDGIAVIDIRGTLMKQQTSLDSGTSTVAMRRSLRALGNDDNVKGVMLRIESPGGSSAGTQELADDIAELAKKKPVNAYIDDLGASAAYWLASQANFISTNPTGWVGSIGTYATVYDYSGAAAADGIKVHVIRAGEFKGAGTPGTEVTEPQLAEWQRLVDQTNAFFLESVAKGRKMSAEQVKGLNDGRVYIGKEAQAKRLVDAVESFDQAMTRLRSTISGKGTRSGSAARSEQDNPVTQVDGGVADGSGSPSPAQAAGQPAGSDAVQRKETEMSSAPTAPATSESKPATMAELKAACPGAPSDFLVEQAEKGATLLQAKDNFLQFQAAQIRSRDEELTKTKAEAEQAKAAAAATTQPAKKPGVAPIGSTSAETSTRQGGSAGTEFKSRVDAKVKAGMSRSNAVSAVVREDPALHAEFIAEANSGRK